MSEAKADTQGPLYISEEYNFFLPNCDSLTATFTSGSLPFLRKRQRFSTSEVSFDLPIKNLPDGLDMISNTKPPTPHCMSKIQLSPPPKYKQRRDSILTQTISIENYDPSSDVMFNDDYTLQALELENILPEELYYSTYSHLTAEEKKKQRQLIAQKVQRIRHIRYELIEDDNRAIGLNNSVNLHYNNVNRYRSRVHLHNYNGNSIGNVGMINLHETKISKDKASHLPKVRAAHLNPQMDENVKTFSTHSGGNVYNKLPLDSYFDLKHINSGAKKTKMIPDNHSEFHIKNIVF